MDWCGTNICLAYHEMIPKDYTQEKVLKILKVMKESTANVVVVFSGEGEFYPFLREFVTQNITGIQWIASEAWITASMLAETYTFLHGWHNWVCNTSRTHPRSPGLPQNSDPRKVPFKPPSSGVVGGSVWLFPLHVQLEQ